MEKHLYKYPDITIVDAFKFWSLCSTSSSEVGLEDMSETEMDITF